MLKEKPIISKDNKMLYTAFKSKDTRFDGRFFVGISSTGIYCIPVCRARMPKVENCTFFSTAAEAEQPGYRPCMLCRPELALGISITEASASLAYNAAKMIEASCGCGQNMEELVGRLGYSGRHLRRVFMAEYNTSPVQYMQTCRLLLAKNLLTDTNLPVLEVAMAAGFGSLRRFNALFKKQYRFSSTALRKREMVGKSQNESITVKLDYRPPYQWKRMLVFLSARAIAGVEVVTKDAYMRSIQLISARRKQANGWMRVSNNPKENTLFVRISETLVCALPQILVRVRHLFDLCCDPEAVYQELSIMNEISPGLCASGTRLPGCFDVFEMAVRAVLGQQITVMAAGTLAAKIVNIYGMPVETGIKELTHIFPLPEIILGLEGEIENHFGPLGVTAVRSQTIYELARLLQRGEINLGFCSRPDEEIKKLMAIRGIGKWTAQYIVMRAMGLTDVFLETDAGIKKALGLYTPKQLSDMAEEWRPWRSYATINIWNTL